MFVLLFGYIAVGFLLIWAIPLLVPVIDIESRCILYLYIYAVILSYKVNVHTFSLFLNQLYILMKFKDYF